MEKLNWKEIQEYRNKGHTLTDVRKRFGVSKSVLNKAVDKGLFVKGDKVVRLSARKVSDEDIIRLYKDGLSQNEIGRRLNISGSSVHHRLKNLNIKKVSEKKNLINDVNWNHIQEYYNMGYFLNEVQIKFNISNKTIYKDGIY